MTVGAIEGNVQQINIRSTVVRTRDGVSIILPNKRLITDEVVNWSHGQKRTRLQVEVGVAYESDLDQVYAVLEKLGQQIREHNDDVLEAIATHEGRNIRRTVESIDREIFTAIADNVFSASHVYTFGMGISAYLAELASYTFVQIGVPAHSMSTGFSSPIATPYFSTTSPPSALPIR